jgi:hypothetical protein
MSLCSITVMQLTLQQQFPSAIRGHQGHCSKQNTKEHFFFFFWKTGILMNFISVYNAALCFIRMLLQQYSRDVRLLLKNAFMVQYCLS